VGESANVFKVVVILFWEIYKAGSPQMGGNKVMLSSTTWCCFWRESEVGENRVKVEKIRMPFFKWGALTVKVRGERLKQLGERNAHVISAVRTSKTESKSGASIGEEG